MRRVLREYISTPAGVTLLLMLLGFWLARYFGARIEDLQQFLFPLALVLAWALPKKQEWKIPTPFLLLACVLWGTTAAHSAGVFTTKRAEPRTVLARLTDDASGLEARSFYRRVNIIGRTYHLPRIALLQRDIATVAEAREWLRDNPESAYLVNGRVGWLHLYFPEDQRLYFKNFSATCSSEQLEAQTISDFQLSGRKDVFVSCRFGQPLVIPFLPTSLSLPDDPPELSRHYAAWLSQGLQRIGLETVPLEDELAIRQDGLDEARRISGLWKSHAPLALAEYLLGTYDLLELSSAPQFQRGLCRSGLARFRKAAGYLPKEGEAELRSQIFANAGTLQAICASSKRDELRAKRWLEMAAVPGTPDTLGSRAALVNSLSFLSQTVENPA